MAITVCWRPLRDRQIYHYWTDDTAKVTVDSACGRSVTRSKLEVYIGFAQDPSKYCKHCLKKLKEIS